MPESLTQSTQIAAELSARATLLPGFATASVPTAVRAFLRAGGRAVLIGETRTEYVARRMSDERRSSETTESFRELVAELRSEAASPIAIAVDQELGGIQRLHGLVDPLPGVTEALALSPDALEARCYDVGAQLRELGVDIVLAPVLDLDPGNPWLAGRLVTEEPQAAARIATAFIRGIQRAGVAATLKHFPGHRGVRTDPAVDQRADVVITRDQLLEDLAPFRAGIDDGASCVMIGPGTIHAIDSINPAVTSRAVIDLLRKECEFTGLTISDDLDMPAIQRDRNLPDVAVDAMAAGNDLLLVSADADLNAIAQALVAAAQSGRLAQHQLEAAARRVAILTRATNRS